MWEEAESHIRSHQRVGWLASSTGCGDICRVVDLFGHEYVFVTKAAGSRKDQRVWRRAERVVITIQLFAGGTVRELKRWEIPDLLVGPNSSEDEGCSRVGAAGVPRVGAAVGCGAGNGAK